MFLSSIFFFNPNLDEGGGEGGGEGVDLPTPQLVFP